MNKFNNERGAIQGFVGWVGIGILVLIFALFFSVCSLFDSNDDENGMKSSPKMELISHEYDDEGGGDESYRSDYSGDESYRSDYGGDRRNQNRGRNRGAFSPGPFDRSPVDFRDNCISLDCGGRDDSKDQPSEIQPSQTQSQPQSLFPPTPAGIRDFVTNVIKSGLEMGQLFADVTIKFVGDLMVGLA